jgi:hypothetical protein
MENGLGAGSLYINHRMPARRFLDRGIRDSLGYQKLKDYIWQTPVKRFLARTPEEYPHSSAHRSFRARLDPVPQRLKPISLPALPQA